MGGVPMTVADVAAPLGAALALAADGRKCSPRALTNCRRRALLHAIRGATSDVPFRFSGMPNFPLPV
jgi:hypothetical protein